MARGRNFRASRVYQTVTQEMANHVMPQYAIQEPPWYKVLNKIPPSEILTRPIPVRHHNVDKNARRARGIFKPQKIVHEEDALRQAFYKDHPWELARPRIILEVDGKDSQRCDWSKGLRQPGLPLSGECVVQRQLWLMTNVQMSRDHAYDVARRELYALRQEEEIEKRVTREEARYVGAYFGKNRLAISQGLEDKSFETWKKWASQAVTLAQQEKSASYADYGGETGEDGDGAEAAEPEEQEVGVPLARA